MSLYSKYVVWFNEVGKEDIALVGGKGANLGEMIAAGFHVPDGFIVTSTAYYSFIKENNLATKIKHLLSTAHFERHESLSQVSLHIQRLIKEGEMSERLIDDINKAYRRLSGSFSDTLVAVRSSATSEDLPNASFAGQQETFLNIKGEANVLQKVKEAWASLFGARAIFYRHEQHFDHFKIGIAIPVQRMIQSDISGVMFTIDPVTNDKSKIVIEAIYGLGEFIVQGKVTPDHYEVHKHSMSIFLKNIASQLIALKKVGTKDKTVGVSLLKRKRQKISDKEILLLAKLGKDLEHHYYFPQDTEWAIEKGKIYIIQTRPVTTVQNSESRIQNKNTQNSELLTLNSKLILKGDPASPGIASGPVKIIHKASEIHKVVSGDVLVAPQTNPDFVPAMKKAVGIITDKGGRTSHAAIVSRELGIPAVVGAEKATKVLKDGNIVTVNGIKGEVYKGGHFKVQSEKLKVQNEEKPITTVTKVYVNLAEPELAGTVAQRNVDGVGLLRAEFMMAGIGIHPKKLIHDGKKKIFIETLAKQLEEFANAFFPRPVVYRASDFKTNEYKALVGGKDYEPQEPNPMLGFRGAFRYIHDPEVFNLELEAIKIVREKKGLQNLWLMIPFVRTVRELIEVKKTVSSAGLHRSSNFKLWMMVEIPSNVILLEKFIYAGIDGVSIGSNDLTMLLLGTDRDNSEVAREFDERNDAVLWAIEHTIKTAHKYRITSSICGQAPSLYPDLVEKLVKWGVTNVSGAPGAIDVVRKRVEATEKKLIM